MFRYGKAEKNAYLTSMRKNKIVQFVSFETILDIEPFLVQWEQYRRSVNSDQDVTLQQSSHKGLFRYIAQHRSTDSEHQFVFLRTRKHSHVPEAEIRTKQAGGYSILQEERGDDTHTGESKIFVFLTGNDSGMDQYRNMPIKFKLNIYEAYYENCLYSYILEFFVKKELVAGLLEGIKQYTTAETGNYKECMLHTA